MRHGRALVAACAALAAGTASAQDCKGPNCPGQKVYPKFESQYIKKFCGPTIVAGSCHGHFQTQWRKWEDACPNGNCDPALAQPVIVSTVETPLEAPKPVEPTKPAELPKTLEAPKPVTPPKLEPAPALVPDKGKSPTAAAPQQLLVPAIPAVPTVVSMPVAK